MTIELKHSFVDKCPDINEWLLSNGKPIDSINSLCHRITQMAEKYALRFGVDQEKGEAKIKGDAFELFTEYMIKSAGSDNRIGIYDYQTIGETGEDDLGVDGVGKGEDGFVATVQCKYRTGDYVLTANEDHLSNFLAASVFDFEVPKESMNNMLIVHTGLKVNQDTMEKMLKGRVRELSRDFLRQMFDNRPEWWARFYDIVNACRTVKETLPVKVLRKHQNEAVGAIFADANGKGKIILPTGSGKSLIFAEAIKKVIEKKMSEGIVPIVKINTSRILLCFQLFEDVCKHLTSHGIAARYVNYNSGQADEKCVTALMRKQDIIYRKLESTTSPEQIKKLYRNCQTDKIPLVVVSTYNSSEKFAESMLVPHITVHDECHNLVSREFSKAATLPSEMNLYFTATEKNTDSDQDAGMNNNEIFDSIIYTKSSKEMIEAGEMLPPYVHIVKANSFQGVDVEKIETDYGVLFQSVVEAYFAHEKKIKSLSFDASKIGAKVLVVCRGQQDLIEMFKTKVFEQFRKDNPDIHVFALSSEFGLYDGQFYKSPVTHSKKYSFLNKLKGLKAHERCIILHVDMIGEGIDVPGITGVMPFRNCEMNKFVQNVGRSTRLHSEDRERFYRDEISPSDRSKYIKGYCWIIIPTFLDRSLGFADRFRGIIEKLRNEFGYIPSEHTVIDNVNGLSDEAVIATVNSKDKIKKHGKSGLVGFSHDFDNLTTMTPLEMVIFQEQAYQEKEKGHAEYLALLKESGIV